MKKWDYKNAIIVTLALVAILSFCFRKSFAPGMALFSNDSPLGQLAADHSDRATAWSGIWTDLNWLGIENPAAVPNITSLNWFFLGSNAVSYSKFIVPLDLLILGLSVVLCLRQFGARYPVCGIAAIAAMLNMNGFSHAAWGLPSRCTSMAMSFVAIGALRSSVNGQGIIKALLAGFAVAHGILEGYDVGAIYSLYVAAFGIFAVLAYGKIDAAHIGSAVVRVGIVAVFAGICAAAGLSTLITTQVQGVSGMQQDTASKEARWDGATMWSVPKAETLRVLVPGLFGYRMDADDGGAYWGSSGQTPGVPQSRHSGSGDYAGALVVVVAAFGIANGFRKKNGPFSTVERRVVLFFAGAALVSLLLAWGRHAPFYRLVYALPFFSTIRNPMKFMHPFHMALLMLFGFGLEALFRVYVKDAEIKTAGIMAAFKAWWAKASPFEKRWVYSSVAFCGLFLLGCFVYMSSRTELLTYLRYSGFPQPAAEKIASFSYTEVMSSWVYISVAVLLVLAAMSGWFSGSRARYLILAMGLFVAFDLMRADLPWITYYNYKDRYASNEIFEFLRKDSFEHRSTARVTPFGSKHLVVDDRGPMNTSFFAGFANQWLQHNFQYYNIQALEPVQMPRPPEIDENYFKALFPGPNQSPTVIPRLWELTNTRYLIGDRNFINGLFQQLEPGQTRHRTVLTFDAQPKPGFAGEAGGVDDYTWVSNPNGRFVIEEFTGALPRAKLYPAWTKMTNDMEVLKELASPGFNPQTNVMISADVLITPATETNFQGTARITSYKPKHIELTVSNNAPAVLLYNDKLSADWKLWVDGKPENFVRANYIMRGIPLSAGTHSVVMKYGTSSRGLYVSLAGFAVAFAALGIVLLGPRNVTREPNP